MFNALTRKKNTFEQQFEKIEDILTKVAANSLEFWNIECDVGHNFKYYFKEYNSNRLIQFKTNPNKRRAKDMIFGPFAFHKASNALNSKKNQSMTTSHMLSTAYRGDKFEEERTNDKIVQ